MNVQFHGFQDARGVTVLSPTVDLTQDYTERTSLRVNYGLDAISAASDSCARCHRRRRQQPPAGGRPLGDAEVRRPEADVRRRLQQGELLSRDDGPRLGVARSGERQHDRGRRLLVLAESADAASDCPSSENQYQSGGFVSVTQTLTKTTIAQAGYELAHITGYQNNPFLRADVNGVMVLGQVPDAAHAADAVRRGCGRRCRPTPTSKPTIGATSTTGR